MKLYRIKTLDLENVERYRDLIKFHVEVTAQEEMENGNFIRAMKIIDKADQILPEVDYLLNSVVRNNEAPWHILERIRHYSEVFEVLRTFRGM